MTLVNSCVREFTTFAGQSGKLYFYFLKRKFAGLRALLA